VECTTSVSLALLPLTELVEVLRRAWGLVGESEDNSAGWGTVHGDIEEALLSCHLFMPRVDRQRSNIENGVLSRLKWERQEQAERPRKRRRQGASGAPYDTR
jgi:hypothetical protein